MIKSFQERMRLQPPRVPVSAVATIASLEGEYAKLRFADNTTSQKSYKLPDSTAKIGSKVRIEKQRGIYLITQVIS